jgi:predicted O-linked N-acetylglucosamine transferase (SPINDLY family)
VRSDKARQKARSAWQRGVEMARRGELIQALQHFTTATEADPADPLYWLNRSTTERKLGQLDAAITHGQRAFDLDRSALLACIHLAEMQRIQRRMEAVIATLDALDAGTERSARWHLQRGLALMHGRQWQAASESLLSAMAGAAGDVDTLTKATQQLGHCFLSLRQHEESGVCYRMLVDRDPMAVGSALYAAHSSAWAVQWDELQTDLTRLQAAMEGVRALPADTKVEALSPFCLLTLTDDAALMRWAADLAKRGTPRPAAALQQPLPRPNGRWRVGLLSCDFHHHATSMLMIEALEGLDRERFELYLYSSGPDDGSALRARMVGVAHAWREVADLSNEALAQQIRADEIALMVDLKGYTQGSRAEALAGRPAPVQISWLGFPGTTGAPYLDYVIGDPVVTPLTHAAHFSEAIAQMPVCYQPNDSQRDQPEPSTRTACGLPPDAFVFASFNQHYKIVPGVFAAWCRILSQVPGSVLWLMAPQPAVQARLVAAALGHGIAAERLVFAPFLKSEAHRARLPNADLFLDTFPCGGHTTASDALWAGLPVLTLAGQGFASRVAASLLGGLGLDRLVCTSLAAYEAQAIALAHQPDALGALRQQLLAARRSSPVFNGRQFAADLGALLSRMAERHDAGLPPAALPAVDLACLPSQAEH